MKNKLIIDKVFKIVLPLVCMAMILNIIYSHHERWEETLKESAFGILLMLIVFLLFREPDQDDDWAGQL